MLFRSVNRFRLERLDEIGFVDKEIPLGKLLVASEELAQGVEIRLDGVLRHVAIAKSRFKRL